MEVELCKRKFQIVESSIHAVDSAMANNWFGCVQSECKVDDDEINALLKTQIGSKNKKKKKAKKAAASGGDAAPAADDK